MQKKYFNLRTLIMLALLAGIGAVMSAFFSIELPMGGVKMVEISLTPIPIMIAGAFFGPLAGCAGRVCCRYSRFLYGSTDGGIQSYFLCDYGDLWCDCGVLLSEKQEQQYMESCRNGCCITDNSIRCAEHSCHMVLL